MIKTAPGGALFLLYLSTAHGGQADVIDVQATCNSSCTFHVTVKHDDQGWQHYADAWDVLTNDGKLLATRTLYHPHEDEQPFTRSLDDVKIPDGVDTVIIRAHDSVHGYGGKAFRLTLPVTKK